MQIVLKEVQDVIDAAEERQLEITENWEAERKRNEEDRRAAEEKQKELERRIADLQAKQQSDGAAVAVRLKRSPRVT